MSTAFENGFGRAWVTEILENVGPLTEALGELDRRAGDGDFGTNITTALKLARTNTQDLGHDAGWSDWLTALYRGFLGVGGTSGPLFALWFREFARGAAGETPTVAEFGAALRAGVETVQHYGNARPGQKTMVDAMVPAAEAVSGDGEDAGNGGSAPVAALQRAVDAAIAGAQSTAGIVAARGRASYVGETARDVIDPGAVTVAVMLQCALAAAGGPAVDTSWIPEG